MKKIWVLVLIMGVAMSGCATIFDKQIAAENNKTVQNHDNAQRDVAIAKTKAIVGVFNSVASDCQEKTYECGALKGMAASNASRDIGAIKTEEYSGPMQKTGVDAQLGALHYTPYVVVGTVAVNGQSKSNRPNQTVQSNGGPVTLDHSMNPTDSAVVNGSGTVSQAISQSDKKNSDNPVSTETSSSSSTTTDSNNQDSTINH